MLVMIDLDNTLADRAGAVETWVDEFCDRWSLPDEAAPWILDQDNDGYSARAQVFQAIHERFQIDAPTEELLAAYQRRVVDLNRPLPGAVSSLQALRAKGWLLVIVTNGSSGQQHAKIDHLRLRDLVDGVVVSGDLGIKKPDRRIFDTAAAEFDVPLERCWMVGDSPVNDVVGPAELGLRTVWLARGRPWPEELDPPTAVINSMDELPEVIGSP